MEDEDVVLEWYNTICNICILYDTRVINTYLAMSSSKSGTILQYDQWMDNVSYHTKVENVLCVPRASFEMSRAREFVVPHLIHRSNMRQLTQTWLTFYYANITLNSC